jgi:protection of telomeres protein 1
LAAYLEKTEGFSGAQHSTEIICFPGKGIPIPELKSDVAKGRQTIPYIAVPPLTKPTQAEQLYAIELKQVSAAFINTLQSDKSNLLASALPASTSYVSTSGKKLALIKDMDFETYYDVRAEVVKIFFHNDRDWVDLYITDYTENQYLLNYEQPSADNECSNDTDPNADPFSYVTVHKKQRPWQGPFGQCTLLVRLWHPHADWAKRNVHEGDFIFIKNLRTKISGSKLEGALHQDRQHPEKVDIKKLEAPEEIEVIRRRGREHEKRMARRPGLDANEPKKPSALKSEKKKEKKKNKKERENAAKFEQLKALEQRSEHNSKPSGNNHSKECRPSIQHTY